MITRIALRVFLTCLVLCASLVLIAIWLGEGVIENAPYGPLYFQTVASLFVVGLGSFLFWLSRILPNLKASSEDT